MEDSTKRAMLYYLAAAALGRERAQELRELVLEGAEETPVARLLRLLEPVKR